MPAFIYTFDHGMAIGYATDQDAADHLWEDAKPAPWADEFEPNGPTTKDWLENGYECGCVNCGHMVSLDEYCAQCEVDSDDDDFDYAMPILDDNSDVFCGQRCRDSHEEHIATCRAERLAKKGGG